MKTLYIRALCERDYMGGVRQYGVEILNEDMTHNQTITSTTLKKIYTRLSSMNYNVIKLARKIIY